ncbi:hypothetical protein K2173_018850 [Erythroxylum novogranatense]|uniref:Gnk2-homologous domain-containing protein n=1 Tax=Erythroxylum novogranatense TaxID=1862640 RepID=A0AAV8SAX3_9ROSI|nr:hypothetical protein K2173_018850 [Erythroxylum novogranatense]
MSSSRSPTAFFLLSFAVLQTVFGADTIQHDCSSLKFFGESPYEYNLNQLLDNLKDRTPPSGFAQHTVGSFFSRVHGLALCRGDLQAKDCGACVAEASNEIRNLCPNSRMAIIWYNNCMLKYSSLYFFGLVDYLHYYYKYNEYNNVKYESHFTQSRNKFLSQLVKQAQTNSKLFGTEVMKLGNSTLYGLAQCTRDLSKSDCKQCLVTAVHRFRQSGHDKSTGWFGFGSCNVRYETYPFLKS